MKLLCDCELVKQAPQARGIDVAALQSQRIFFMRQTVHFVEAGVRHCDPCSSHLKARLNFIPVDGGNKGRHESLLVFYGLCDAKQLIVQRSHSRISSIARGSRGTFA
jgi:hypothetical protein